MSDKEDSDEYEYGYEDEDEYEYEGEEENDLSEEGEEEYGEEEYGEDESEYEDVSTDNSGRTTENDTLEEFVRDMKRGRYRNKRREDSSDLSREGGKYKSRYRATRDTGESSGGNYFSGEETTREDLERYFGFDRSDPSDQEEERGRRGGRRSSKKSSLRSNSRPQEFSESDSMEPIEHVAFSDKYLRDGRPPSREVLEEQFKNLQSRIRNLKRLLEKGGLDPGVEAMELRKMRRLNERLRKMQIKLYDRAPNYNSQLNDLKDKLDVIRKSKNKHNVKKNFFFFFFFFFDFIFFSLKKTVHALRTLKYERETKGINNDKERNHLNQTRKYLEHKIEDLGGHASEDSRIFFF